MARNQHMYNPCAPGAAPLTGAVPPGVPGSSIKDSSFVGSGLASSEKFSADEFFWDRMTVATLLAINSKQDGMLTRVNMGVPEMIFRHDQDTPCILHIRPSLPTNSIAVEPMLYLGWSASISGSYKGAISMLRAHESDKFTVQPGQTVWAYLIASAGTFAVVQAGPAYLRSMYYAAKDAETSILRNSGR